MAKDLRHSPSDFPSSHDLLKLWKGTELRKLISHNKDVSGFAASISAKAMRRGQTEMELVKRLINYKAKIYCKLVTTSKFTLPQIINPQLAHPAVAMLITVILATTIPLIGVGSAKKHIKR